MSRVFWFKAFGTVFGGWMLACGFPLPPGFEHMESTGAAWMALIPLILIARTSSPRWAFTWGWAFGLVFWLLTLVWLLALRHTWGGVVLPLLGWFALSAYCALYFGLFASLLSAVPDTWRVLPVLALPVLWVGCEWLRASLFSGFPWNPLGVSQYRNIAVIQVASIGGVYAVSGLVALLNGALALTMLRVCREIRQRVPRRRVHVELMIGLAAVAICWSWGVSTVRGVSSADAGTVVRIAAVQPAIPQLQKWSEDQAAENYRALQEQSDLAMMSRPHLMVWPETATPDMLRVDPDALMLAQSLTSQGTYLLAGSMDYQQGIKDMEYLNASFLLAPDGKGVEAAYVKRHLVLFGECLPFERKIPFLQRWAPLGFSCLPGALEQPLVEFSVRQEASEAVSVAVSVLICFEDIFTYLARRDVRRGARLLINQTNDAWFDGSAASRQHMANAVLRTVENRVPLVRAANTGVTCFLDRVGRLTTPRSYAFTSSRGYSVDSVTVPAPSMPLTPYTRLGDWLLAIPCTLLMGVGAGLLIYKRMASRARI